MKTVNDNLEDISGGAPGLGGGVAGAITGGLAGFAATGGKSAGAICGAAAGAAVGALGVSPGSQGVVGAAAGVACANADRGDGPSPGKVICTELCRNGVIELDVWMADIRYSRD